LIEASPTTRLANSDFGLTEAVAPEHEDLRVLDEPVGDRRGDGRIEENVAPVGEIVERFWLWRVEIT
jgi:hypothetical protein